MFQVLALLASGRSILGSKVYSFHYVEVIHHEENVEKNMSMAVEVALLASMFAKWTVT